MTLQPNPARTNLGILLREPFRIGNDELHRRIAESGHPHVRPPHGYVFQFLDAEGTRVSDLAQRAQMTKQSMAELVSHLEQHGYVERIADPRDRRAKLVRPTERGRQVYAIAREIIADIERRWTASLGELKIEQLRTLLEDLNELL